MTAQPVGQRRGDAADHAARPAAAGLGVPVADEVAPPPPVLDALVGRWEMGVHERHDHLDEIPQPGDDKGHFVVVVGLAAVMLDEPSYAEAVLQGLADRCVDGTKPYLKEESAVSRCLGRRKTAFGRDEAAYPRRQVISSRLHGSSGCDRGRDRAPVVRSRVPSMMTARVPTGSDVRSRRDRAPPSSARTAAASSRAAGTGP